MLTKNYDLTEFAKKAGLDSNFFNIQRVAIINTSLKNDVFSNKKYNYEMARIFCVGLISNNKLIQIYDLNDDNDKFYHYIYESILPIVKENMVYAYNTIKETAILKACLGMELNIKDIKPFKAWGWSRHRFYEQIIREAFSERIECIEETDINPIKEYERYQINNDTTAILKILSNNMSNLIKDFIILKFSDKLKENYQTDNNGWIIKEKQNKEILKGRIYKIQQNDKNNRTAFIIVEHNDRLCECQVRFFSKDYMGLEFPENSNYDRYLKHYGKMPEINDNVNVVAVNNRYSIDFGDESFEHEHE